MDDTKKLVSDRFNELLEALGLTVTSFSKELGYDRSDKFYNISKGKYFPSFEILQEITNNFVNIDMNWLISGRGSMFFDKNTLSNTYPNTPLNAINGENEAESVILSPFPDRLLSKIDEKDNKIEEKDAVIAEQSRNIGALQKEVEMLQKGFRAKGMDSIVSDNVEVAEHANAQQ